MRAALSLLFALTPYVALAQEPAEFVGHWEGEIETVGLTVDVDLAYADGTWAGDISIPAQNARDLPLAGFRLEGRTLTFVIEGVPGEPTFVATLAEDGDTLAGPFTQATLETRFSLARAEDRAAVTARELAELGAFLEQLMADWKVPGLGLAVVADGEVVLAEGYGKRDVEADLPVTPRTLFAIGSSSKAFTTFAMGVLVDRGALDWDEPVIRYLPGFRLHDELATLHLTPRDMVCHRSGLPRHDLAWYNRAELGPAELFEVLHAFEPNRELRERFQYNNMMFVTAGHLVATLMSRSWEEAIRELVLEPLGMARTNFSVSASQADEDHAAPYDERDDELRRIPFRNIENVGPAGSINSCPEEMARWLLVQLGGGEVDGQRLIEAGTLRQMHTPQMVFGNLPSEPELAPGSYGLGWMIDGYRGHLRVHHGGNIDGFSALVSMFPNDDMGICVLTNRNGSPVPEFVVRAIADRVFGLEPKDWSTKALAQVTQQKEAAEQGEERDEGERAADTTPHHPLPEYAGEYVHPGYGTLTVTFDGGALGFTYNGITAPLEHWHYETFRAGEDAEDPAFKGLKLLFETDVDGRIAALTAPFEPSVGRIRFERAADSELTDPEYLARFVGRYELAGQKIRVTLSDGELSIAPPNQPATALVPLQDDTFGIEETDAVTFRFVSEDGRVTELVVKQPGASLVAKRVDG